MVALVNLPGYKPNPLMDFSSINDAIDSRQQAAWKLAQMGEDTRRWNATNQLNQQKFELQKGADARAAEMAPLERQRVQAQLEQMRRQGASEAQMAPLKIKLLEAQTGLAEAQASSARQKDELNSAIAGIVRGAMPPIGQPQSAIPQSQPTLPQVQPQSFQGQGPQANPMLIPTQAGPASPPSAPQGAQGPQSAPNMVSTPMGPMSFERAQQLGFALGLAGKGDAGKILIDAAKADRLGKKATGDVEEQLINRISDLSDLQNIKTQFQKDPQMLELGSRLKATGLSWQAWLGSKSVSPEDRKWLANYQRLRTATTDRLNSRIKAFAGTAVSGQEKVRMYAANPNENDDPITFEAKLDEQMNIQRSAIARYNWLRRRGLQPSQIKELAESGRIEGMAGLDDMKGIYDQRGQQIEQQLRQQRPNLQPQQYRELRNRQLKQEFGI
jgi:hypothetical protein